MKKLYLLVIVIAGCLVSGTLMAQTANVLTSNFNWNSVVSGCANGQPLQFTTASGFVCGTLVTATGDLNITSGGVVTVTGIQGTSVSAPTGTGAVVLATSPALNTATLGSGSTLTDVINQDHSANTTATTVYTSNTTLGQVTGLSATLTAGGTYDCLGHLSLTADSAGGVKAAVGGTVGATGMSFTFTNWNGATVNAKGTVTALSTAAAGATAVATDVDIQGAIVVSTAGTFYPMAAENASDATATTINKYSFFACQRIN